MCGGRFYCSIEPISGTSSDVGMAREKCRAASYTPGVRRARRHLARVDRLAEREEHVDVLVRLDPAKLEHGYPDRLSLP